MATQTALNKQSLDVKTNMSDSIFLPPVAPNQKVVYLKLHNTSDKQDVNIEHFLVSDLQAKGYKVTNDPNKAHYILQANILRAGKVEPNGADMAVDGAVGGGVAGAAISGATGGSGADIAGAAIAGAVVGTVADAVFKDIGYSLVTDVQISERSDTVVHEETKQELAQGTSGTTTTKASNNSHWKQYRTKIISSADKMNLKFSEAQPYLEKGLASSIAGLF
tara:strand:- start:29095 stop:29757 length:663 start_codon:yes stop_codon:yes gene_type:complete